MNIDRIVKRQNLKKLKKLYAKYIKLKDPTSKYIKGLEVLWEVNPKLAHQKTEEFLKKLEYDKLSKVWKGN